MGRVQPTLDATRTKRSLIIAMESRRFESLPTHELDQSETLTYREFRQRCADSGLLERPVGLGERDVPDGVNDDLTIL